MSRDNVETIRRAVEKFNEVGMGSDAAMAFLDPAVVFEEPPEQPGASIAHGRDTLQRMFGEFDAAWEGHRSEPEEIRALDEERVLLLSIEHFRGRDGVELSQACATIFTLRDGRVTRMQAFWDRANALAAADAA